MSDLASPTGSASTQHTPVSDDQRHQIKVTVCDKHVPAAPSGAIGHCEYYYRPLHQEYVEKSGVATWKAIKAWLTRWNPWDNTEVVTKLIQDRDNLIKADSSSINWSRHASFMMRHIGCGHTPPTYYVGYGYYYCSRYGALLKPRLSSEGKKWLKSARQKLQENMENGLDDNMEGNIINVPCKRYPNRSVNMVVPQYQVELDSAQFKTFAFNTHVPAYLDAGLADLGAMDLAQIGTEPNIEEWASGDTWKQALDSGEEVLIDKASQAWDAAVHAAKDAGNTVEEALHRLMKKFR